VEHPTSFGRFGQQPDGHLASIIRPKALARFSTSGAKLAVLVIGKAGTHIAPLRCGEPHRRLRCTTKEELRDFPKSYASVPPGKKSQGPAVRAWRMTPDESATHTACGFSDRINVQSSRTRGRSDDCRYSRADRIWLVVHAPRSLRCDCNGYARRRGAHGEHRRSWLKPGVSSRKRSPLGVWGSAMVCCRHETDGKRSGPFGKPTMFERTQPQAIVNRRRTNIQEDQSCRKYITRRCWPASRYASPVRW